MMIGRRLARVLLASGVAAALLGACGTSAPSKPDPSSAVTTAPVTTPPVTVRPTLPHPTPAPAPAPAPRPHLTVIGTLRVALWGDSISAQAAPYFTDQLAHSGKAVGVTHTFPGTALCDWISDIRNALNPANLNGFHPEAVVIQFSGDAFTPCMRGPNGVAAYSGRALIDKYAADAAVVIGLGAAAKVPVYFVSTPISRGEAALGYVGNTPFGKLFSTFPARYPGRTARFIDGAAAVEWHGHYTATLPCQPGEVCTGTWPNGTKTVVVRQADGGHFCPVKEVPDGGSLGLLKCPVYMPGANRFMNAITSRILQDFGLA